MKGKIVSFKKDSEIYDGAIVDKYQGYKWVESASHDGKMKTCIPIDYYLIESLDLKLFHVPCDEILGIHGRDNSDRNDILFYKKKWKK
jgi:hypothetical protein